MSIGIADVMLLERVRPGQGVTARYRLARVLRVRACQRMEHMPTNSPHTGVCISCGQHWTVNFPAFDIYCPRCHALVMRRRAFHRVTSALLMGGVSSSSVGS